MEQIMIEFAVGIALIVIAVFYTILVKKMLHQPQPLVWCKEGMVADWHAVMITGCYVIGVAVIVAYVLKHWL